MVNLDYGEEMNMENLNKVFSKVKSMLDNDNQLVMDIKHHSDRPNSIQMKNETKAKSTDFSKLESISLEE